MAPDPGGVGSLLPWPGLRTHDSSCSAVHPCGAKFGSAPASSSVAASSKCALLTASISALGPLPRGASAALPMFVTRGGGPPMMVSSTFAPLASSARTTPTWLSRTANRKGVRPPFERALRSAPAATSACTAATWPSAAAHISAVWPFHFSVALTFAPWAISALTAGAMPARAASIRGVSPSADARFGSAPAFTNASMMAALPLVLARARGVTPYRLVALALAPASNQQVGDLEVVGVRGPMQRGRSVGLRDIHVRALLHQRSNGRLVRLLDRIRHGGGRNGRISAADAQEQAHHASTKTVQAHHRFPPSDSRIRPLFYTLPARGVKGSRGSRVLRQRVLEVQKGALEP